MKADQCSKLGFYKLIAACIAALAVAFIGTSCEMPADPYHIPDVVRNTRWTATFYVNGGAPTPIPQIIGYNGKAKRPIPDPSRSGYIFGGWYSDNNTFEEEWDFNNRVVTEDIALYAKWGYAVRVTVRNAQGYDSVTSETSIRLHGENITLHYTLDDISFFNQLEFSGVSKPHDLVDIPGGGSWTYTVDMADAIGGVIAIYANFSHADKPFDSIGFADYNDEYRTYGDASYTKAIVNTGLGTGAISYESSDPAVAAVNAITGEVTIYSRGEITITARKEESYTHAEAVAYYNLHVSPKPLVLFIDSEYSLMPLDSSRDIEVTIDGLVDFDTVTVNISGSDYGLSLSNNTGMDGTRKTMTLSYDCVTPVMTISPVYLPLIITDNDNYIFSGSPALNVMVIDGQNQARPIPVTQGNIAAFNTYANTTNGLTRHFKLMESVTLQSNWAAIGTNTGRFTGSFDGQGYTITGLTINTTQNYRGMFGFIGTAGVVKNLALDCTISGAEYTGGVAGQNFGTVEFCSVSGSVEGQRFAGGVAGVNSGTVRNCLVSGSVSGIEYIGGVAGQNSGTVGYCLVSGSVTGDFFIGSIAGSINGTVQNCVALNENISASDNYGRVVGEHYGTLSNNYARSDMTINGIAITWANIGTEARDGMDIGSIQCSDMDWWRYTAGFFNSWWADKLPPDINITTNPLTIAITADPTKTLTPIPSERTDTFTVQVSGFGHDSEANSVGLLIYSYTGLSFNGHTVIRPATNGTKTFTVTVSYDGITPLDYCYIEVYGLTDIPGGYVCIDSYKYTYINVIDGRDEYYPIPITQSNVAAFNAYATGTTTRTDALKRHYRLDESITLTTNWTAIGPFTGSFDGNDQTISNLAINVTTNANQGLFSEIGTSGTVRNLTLYNCDVRANGNVGGVAGLNSGTVQNCVISGTVRGSYNGMLGFVGVGGIVGENRGIVESCDFTGNVIDAGGPGKSSVGGAVGFNNNNAVVRDCSVSGIVTGTDYVGGVAGGNNHNSVVENCLALNLNINATGMLFGRIVGYNDGTLSNNYGHIDVLRNDSPRTWANDANGEDGANYIP
jgi:uncharacterized repeat protein (TIGR02543 family)